MVYTVHVDRNGFLETIGKCTTVFKNPTVAKPTHFWWCCQFQKIHSSWLKHWWLRPLQSLVAGLTEVDNGAFHTVHSIPILVVSQNKGTPNDLILTIISNYILVINQAFLGSQTGLRNPTILVPSMAYSFHGSLVPNRYFSSLGSGRYTMATIQGGEALHEIQPLW